MSTLLVTQRNFENHQTPQGHPERPARLAAVIEALDDAQFSRLVREDAVEGDLDLADTVHDSSVMDAIRRARPAEGIGQIDGDTFVSDASLKASATALGAGLRGVQAVMEGDVDNVFCAVRPPGHHAERARSMGFCLVNTIALVAHQARALYGVERVAIIDFDVHHGNGTQDIFQADADTFYASSHQAPLYPGTGAPHERGVGNIVNAPLPAQSGGAEMRAAYEEQILPALADFSPDLILMSAGFDAERRDPLAQLNWRDADFGWLTAKLVEAAGTHCGNRLVSLLEGGYDLGGLADGVSAHVHTLMTGQAGR